MEIRVEINDEVGQEILTEYELEQIVTTVLLGEGVPQPCEVSVSFVDEQGIQELNREYRGIDKPTDVLSFNIDDISDFMDACDDDDEYDEGAYDDDAMTDDEDDEDAEDDDAEDDAQEIPSPFEAFDVPDEACVFMAGDIILCPAVISAQAAGFGNSIPDEMRLLLVHGCLHLMGYDHEVVEEAEEMEALERVYLNGFIDAGVDEINVGPTVDHRAEGTAACLQRS